jgi:hypothetical protein
MQAPAHTLNQITLRLQQVYLLLPVLSGTTVFAMLGLRLGSVTSNLTTPHDDALRILRVNTVEFLGPGHPQDFLEVVRQGVEQFLAKYSRLLLLKHLQYHGLIADGSSVAGVGLKQSVGVQNKTVDVDNCLGGHIVYWLVVGGWLEDALL